MFRLNKIGVYVLCSTMLLSGCGTSGGGLSTGFGVGPQLSSYFDPKGKAEVDLSKPKLDIIVPVFDPGLSKSAEDYEEEGIWPELRRAEANRFASKLKAALEKTGAFGAVRVTPDSTATGDLYVMGKIIESTGEDVEIEIKVVDISGQRWFTRSFDSSIEPEFYKNIRNSGTDPYDPVFDEAANRVALELDDYSSEKLVNFKRMTDLRFGSNFTAEAFSEHIEIDEGKAILISFPSEQDPMLLRTRAIRVRDQLFVDGLQEDYRSFSEKMEPSYLIWQEQSLLELEAKSESQLKAAGEAAIGILTIGVAILAIAAGANSDNVTSSTAALTGGIVAGAVGAHFIEKSFQTSEEAKVHRDALGELGESINIDLAPRVVDFEKQTVKLTGDSKEQYAQWRNFLQEIYDQERTPEKQL